MIRRKLRALRRGLELTAAMLFGKYVHSTGGPDQHDDGVVYQWRGRAYKWCEPDTEYQWRRPTGRELM